jgi:hypothetical protein
MWWVWQGGVQQKPSAAYEYHLSLEPGNLAFFPLFQEGIGESPMQTNLIEYIWPGIIASEAIHVAAKRR